MARIVLVHGAWSTGATWDEVAAILRRAGHDVTAPTLPGHGDDPTPPSEVGLGTYAAYVADVLDQGEPALLVGHSMGGMVISAAAELAPEKVTRLVYVAAFIPQNGQSLLDLVKLQDGVGIQPAILKGAQPGTTALNPEIAADFLFQDATPSQRAQGLAGLTRQPNAGQTEAAILSEDNFGTLPRAYVFCEDDRTVPPALQRAMVAASPCAPTFTLKCGHVPQLTCANQLAAILETL